MYLQHDDPHRHTAPGIETVYLFLILAPILVAFLLFLAWKVMNYVEKRRALESLEKSEMSEETNEKRADLRSLIDEELKQ